MTLKSRYLSCRDQHVHTPPRCPDVHVCGVTPALRMLNGPILVANNCFSSHIAVDSLCTYPFLIRRIDQEDAQNDTTQVSAAYRGNPMDSSHSPSNDLIKF